jgi:hypothetical protein
MPTNPFEPEEETEVAGTYRLAAHRKLDIAKEHLNLAIRCYLGRSNYFSAILLAGAAEEIFGMALHQEDRISTAAIRARKELIEKETGRTPKDGEVKHIVNWSRNSVKHVKDGNFHVLMNEVCEARRWIDEALTNYFKLGFPKTPEILKYEDCAAEDARHSSGA